MSHETNDLKQTATLWACSGIDRDGEPTVSAGADISVRWVVKVVESMDPKGRPVKYDATVAAGQEIAMNSIMWLGKVADFDGDNVSDLFIVKDRSRTPDVKGKNIRWEYALQRHSDTLPTIA